MKNARTALKALAAAALLALPAASMAPAAFGQDNPDDAPLPGHWRYSYKVLILPAGDDDKCLTPKDVKRFFDGLCNKGSKCTYTTNDAENGKVKLVGLWVDHKGRRTKVKGNGVYNQTSFKLKANIVLNSGFPVSGTIEGKRISDTCPAGLK